MKNACLHSLLFHSFGRKDWKVRDHCGFCSVVPSTAGFPPCCCAAPQPSGFATSVYYPAVLKSGVGNQLQRLLGRCGQGCLCVSRVCLGLLQKTLFLEAPCVPGHVALFIPHARSRRSVWVARHVSPGSQSLLL